MPGDRLHPNWSARRGVPHLLGKLWERTAQVFQGIPEYFQFPTCDHIFFLGEGFDCDSYHLLTVRQIHQHVISGLKPVQSHRGHTRKGVPRLDVDDLYAIKTL